MSYTSGSHTVFHHRYHIVWITKYRYKVLEGALRERIRTIIRQLCKELGVQIVSGVLSREHVLCSWKSRRILRSATSCGASRDAHRIRCRWSSRTCASACSGLLHHQRQHHGRCHTSVSSEARTYRRQPVVIQFPVGLVLIVIGVEGRLVWLLP